MNREGQPRWRQGLARLQRLRFIRFGAIGATGALVNLGVLYIGQELLYRAVAQPARRLDLSLATAIGVATLNNFAWNRLWTWHDRPRSHGWSMLAQFARYAMSSWVGILLQVLIAKLLAAHWNYLLASGVAIVAASACNFMLNDLWTFRRRRLAAGIDPVRGT